MTDALQAQHALPENVLIVSSLEREWNGVSLTVTAFHCAGRVSHHLRNESATRLSVLLEEVGSHCEPRLRQNEPCAIGYLPPIVGRSAQRSKIRLTFAGSDRAFHLTL